ncbi:MAG: thiosulfate oxidation carrier protein SoxY [Sulfuriferula multivorans]|uniref:Thiosulfate oxidation carrier protein SoxY n=1 Tax=Sulfuriferula multivorans TaxID=1559896 RepID=A0A7C9K0L4_9PROT|nr:thiosulfate oxidation carrier protein SoxY [Sulfuriferula multivorans]
MNALRRNVLKSAAGAGTVAVAVAAGLLKPTMALAGAPRTAFEAKNVGDALKGMGATGAADSKDITIKAPDIAENGAVVPVEVTSSIAGTTAIAIISEKNATPLVADFDLSNGAQGFISTRIKMGQTSLVRAVVTAGGKTYTAAKEVKVTIGGCGG